jgi:uncharacterized membrane protein YuzA (DUF378 family)
MKAFDIITGIIMVVGGINWGLVGLFEFDLVAAIFGTLTPITRAVYIIVALCSIYHLVAAKAIAHRMADHPHRPVAATTTGA